MCNVGICASLRLPAHPQIPEIACQSWDCAKYAIAGDTPSMTYMSSTPLTTLCWYALL